MASILKVNKLQHTNGTDALTVASDGSFSGTLGSSSTIPASIGSSLVLLNTTTISTAVANVNFDNTLITTTYNTYKVTIEGLSSSADDFDLDMMVSNNNGTSFISSRSAQSWMQLNGTGQAWNHSIGDFPVWRDVEGTDNESGGNGSVEIILSQSNLLLDCSVNAWSTVKNQNHNFFPNRRPTSGRFNNARHQSSFSKYH